MTTNFILPKETVRRILIDMITMTINATIPTKVRIPKHARVLLECGCYAYIRYMQKRGYDREAIVGLACVAARDRYNRNVK